MRTVRRLVSWCLFLGCLAALGVGVFAFVRHRPRCTIVGPLAQVHLLADGSRLLTLDVDDKFTGGALRVWDLGSGQLLHEWFDGAKVQRFERSPDGRHVAVSLDDGLLRLVDWHTGVHWLVEEPRDVNRFDFSPGGRWLIVGTARGDPNFLIEVATRRVALRLRDGWPRISSNDRLLYDRKGTDCKITVSDLQGGKTLGVLALTAAEYEISPDGRLLLEKLREPVPRDADERKDGLFAGVGVKRIERQDYRVDVWDLTTFQKRFRHELARAGNLQTAFSPDGQFLAMWLRVEPKQSHFEVVDTATDRLLWSFPIRMAENGDFSADGSLVYLVQEFDPKNSVLTMFDAETGRVLWERPSGGTTYFAGKTGVLMHQEDFTKPQLFLDACTGEERATVPLDFSTANYIPLLTPDGRHFVIGGWQVRQRQPFFWEVWLEKHWPEVFGDGRPGVLVMETATGRELFRLINRGDQKYSLSDDGGTLITVDPSGDGEFVFRAWDVRPTRAWIWAISVALGAGGALQFIVWRWRGLRACSPKGTGVSKARSQSSA
jgi:WD40 repeat protein